MEITSSGTLGTCSSENHNQYLKIPDSIVVSISACHAEDPGSIPGRGASFALLAPGLGSPESRVGPHLFPSLEGGPFRVMCSVSSSRFHFWLYCTKRDMREEWVNVFAQVMIWFEIGQSRKAFEQFISGNGNKLALGLGVDQILW